MWKAFNSVTSTLLHTGVSARVNKHLSAVRSAPTLAPLQQRDTTRSRSTAEQEGEQESRANQRLSEGLSQEFARDREGCVICCDRDASGCSNSISTLACRVERDHSLLRDGYLQLLLS